VNIPQYLGMFIFASTMTVNWGGGVETALIAQKTDPLTKSNSLFHMNVPVHYSDSWGWGCTVGVVIGGWGGGVA
jgi:hypothetical protein